MMLRLPGVYAPEHDTEFLIREILADDDLSGARALEIGTGTGRIALALKRAGAAQVVAVDISRRAILSARLNSALHRLPVRTHRHDLLPPGTAQFDVIVANPPYVPCGSGPPPRHSAARAWDAGLDGRAVLDRICVLAPTRLAPGGRLWIVHSALSGAHQSLDLLDRHGLYAEIAAKHQVPFGPVMRARAPWLLTQGLIDEGQRHEDLVVIRAHKR
ncbi:MAG: HemK2/MTQ2 family protein methyltransferase [Sporichthyaceae bacterium]